MTNRPIGAIIGLCIAAMGSGAVYMLANVEEAPPLPAAQPGVGYYVRDARLTGTDENGEPTYDLTATMARQTRADGVIALENVRVSYKPDTAGAWNLRARTGRMPADATIIRLTGDVVGTSGNSGGPTTTIRTDYLEYEPATYAARTDREVTVDYAGGTVRGRGMRANFRDGTVELLSRVNGRYTFP